MVSISNEVWSEKYRPDTLSEVIGHDDKIERLEQWTDDGSMPHMIFSGPAGTGKTATAVALARDIYGEEHWKSNIIEMNASDSRGIDVVREEIKSIARQSPSGKFPFKIIFLDEADQLTKDAQAALRRVMEQFSDQTRFILSMNFISKVIDPIQSRCTVMSFDRLSDNEINQLITQILVKENVEYEESAVNKIIEYVEGDARRAVHTLQTSVSDGQLTEDIIQVVGGQVEDKVVEDIVSKSLNGEMEEAQEMVVTDVLPNVTDYSKFTGTLMRKIQNSDELPRDVKFYALSQLGELESNIMEGCNPNVQINSYLSKLPVARYSSIPNYQGE